MKSHEAKLVIIDGCGSELLDAVLATVNYELSGDEAVLVYTEDLTNSQDTHGQVEKILEHINSNEGAPINKPYEGLVLLRR